MGAIADAGVQYTQPLIDATDGSEEELNRAFALGQICWNLALLPEDGREEFLAEIRPTLGMDDDEFEAFQQTLLIPMLERHKEMFPMMHQRTRVGTVAGMPAASLETRSSRGGKYPGTGRYDPCPCNSGEKYKFCCGRS